jgi:hypothetical protein
MARWGRTASILFSRQGVITMKWTAKQETSLGKLDCTIKHDKYAGYYLYIYINGVDTYDYLQDTYDIAVDQAFEQFGVPKDAWQKVR